MFCSKCGASLNDDAQFCSQCGTQVQASVVSPASNPRPLPASSQKFIKCRVCGNARPSLTLPQVLLLVGLPIAAYLASFVLGILIAALTENVIATVIAAYGPWIAYLVYLIIFINRMMNTPCYHCQITPTAATLNRRHSRQTMADKLMDKIFFVIDPVYTLRMAGHSCMDRVATATKRKNIFPYISIVFFGASFIPLFGKIKLKLLMDGEPIGGRWGTAEVSFLDIYGNFSVALTCILFLGYVAFFVATFLNLLSQSRGSGIVRPIAWGGFACHLIAILFMTQSLVCEEMISRNGYLEYMDVEEFSVSCPMGAVKIALLAIDALCLVWCHLSYQYDKRVWMKQPKKMEKKNTTP